MTIFRYFFLSRCCRIFSTFHLVSGLLIVHNPKSHSQFSIFILFPHEFCFFMRSRAHLTHRFHSNLQFLRWFFISVINWSNRIQRYCTTKEKLGKIVKQMESWVLKIKPVRVCWFYILHIIMNLLISSTKTNQWIKSVDFIKRVILYALTSYNVQCTKEIVNTFWKSFENRKTNNCLANEPTNHFWFNAKPKDKLWMYPVNKSSPTFELPKSTKFLC